MDLQQITQWFGYDLVITCEMVTNDKLHGTEWNRVESNPSPSFGCYRKKFLNSHSFCSAN